MEFSKKIISLFVFFSVVGFFLFVPYKKAFAYLETPPFPNFPTVDTMSEPQYDGRRQASMTGELMIYGGNTSKYFFAVKFHQSPEFKIKFYQDHNLGNQPVGMWLGDPYYPNVNEHMWGYVIYVLYNGEWVHYMSNTVETVYGENYNAVAGSTGCPTTGSPLRGICLSHDYRLTDIVKSTDTMYWQNAYDNHLFPSAFNSYPNAAAGDVFPTGLLYSSPANTDYQSSYPYYLHFRSSLGSGIIYSLESDGKCVLDPFNVNALSQQFRCLSGFFSLYELKTNGEKVKLDTTTMPFLQTPNAPNTFCEMIVSSNYNLMSIGGEAVCKATTPSYVADLIASYHDPIDPTAIQAQDWGVGEWFKTPFMWFVSIVNGVASWGYNLYYNFMLFITPDPDLFSWYAGTIKTAFEQKVGGIDITALEAFKDIDENQLNDISIHFFGQDMVIFDFDLLKQNIGLLRPVAIASIGYYMLIFSVNGLNRILNDREAV